MPYINGKRVTLDQWRAAHPFQKWPPESADDEAPEPEPEPAPKKAVRKTKAVAAAIKQSTGVDVDDVPA